MSKILSDEDGDTIWNDPTPNIDDEIESNLDVILIKFAVRVLDVYQDKENPTFGDLIDTPAQTIKQLITDARVEAVQELKRRWNDDRKTMDYSPATYQFICDKYIKELKENKRWKQNT